MPSSIWVSPGHELQVYQVRQFSSSEEGSSPEHPDSSCMAGDKLKKKPSSGRIGFSLTTKNKMSLCPNIGSKRVVFHYPCRTSSWPRVPDFNTRRHLLYIHGIWQIMVLHEPQNMLEHICSKKLKNANLQCPGQFILHLHPACPVWFIQFVRSLQEQEVVLPLWPVYHFVMHNSTWSGISSAFITWTLFYFVATTYPMRLLRNSSGVVDTLPSPTRDNSTSCFQLTIVIFILPIQWGWVALTSFCGTTSMEGLRKQNSTSLRPSCQSKDKEKFLRIFAIDSYTASSTSSTFPSRSEPTTQCLNFWHNFYSHKVQKDCSQNKRG